MLFWLVAVTDASKASRLAYEVIKEKSDANIALGRAIHDRLVAEGAAVRLPAQEDINNKPGLVFSPGTMNLLRGQSRFNFETDGQEAWICDFYRKHWWRPWTHQHPILLWVQREMVSDELDQEAVAGKDEDTPYDYDHILPYSHWGKWTGIKPGDRLLDCAEGEISVVGNAIGNIRVWASSLNRADSDKPPTDKLGLDVDDNERRTLLKYSAIDANQIEDWKVASGHVGKRRSWSCDRAMAFQRAVEKRTFQLYQLYFDELGFAEWSHSAPDLQPRALTEIISNDFTNSLPSSRISISLGKNDASQLAQAG